MSKKLEDSVVKEIIYMYNLGLGSVTISERLNCSTTTVLNILKANNIQTHEYKKKLAESSVDEMESLYLGGSSVQDLADKFDLTSKVVRKYLKRRGVFNRKKNKNIKIHDAQVKENIICVEGQCLSADYILTLNRPQKLDLAEKILLYYRKHGFPYPRHDEQTLYDEFYKLSKFDTNEIINSGLIKNTTNNGLKITKHFTGSFFYNSKLNSSKSCCEVFNNDDLFLKTIKGMLGFNISENIPNIFSITNSSIINGIINTGLAMGVSQFKPVVAKFLYEKYCQKEGKVLDFAAGWGARALAAMSLGLDYTGIDPLTYNKINELIRFFDYNNIRLIDGCSEDNKLFDDFESKFDFIFSSPPYFDLEVYSDDDKQCYVKNNIYVKWLQQYWRPTVINCSKIIAPGGHFGYSMVDKYRIYDIANDIAEICKNHFELVDTYTLLNTRNHLNKTDNEGNAYKLNEKIYIYKLRK